MATYRSEPRSSLFTRSFVFALLGFGTFGMISGILQVLLTDLLRALELTPGSLGAALTLGSIGSLPIMFFGGRLADRFGLQTLLAVSGVALAAALVGFAITASYLVLVFLFLVFACASGAFDVGINAASITAEQRSGHKLIPYCHAAFSGFAALGAMLSGLLLSFGVSFRLLYFLAAIVCALYVAAMLLAQALPHKAPPKVNAEGVGASRSLFRQPVLLLLGGIVALASISESSLENWSAVYLRTVMGLPVLLGASGVALYHAAMFTGRVITARLVTKVERRTLLIGAGLCALVGMALALSTRQPSLVLIGFFVVGLALSGVAPIGFSVAGDLSEGRARETSSVMTLVSYSGFLVAPSLIGVLADAFGLRAALGSVLISGLLVALLSTRIRAK
jgi:MFS family permease